MPVGLRVTGASGSAAAADAAALDILGDIDIRVQCSLDDWTPAASNTLAAKWNDTGNQRSWVFRVTTSGALEFAWSADGTAVLGPLTSSAPTGFTDGTTRWVRVAFDVDNGASGRTASFFTSTDGTNWTPLGTPQTTAGVTSLFNSTASLTVGGRADSTQPATGWFYRAEVRNSANALVAAPDFRIQREGAILGFTDAAGTTWFAGPTVHDGVFQVGSEEALQAQSQRQYGRDLNGGLRIASGIAKDANGVSQQLWGTELYKSRDQAYALLGGT